MFNFINTKEINIIRNDYKLLITLPIALVLMIFVVLTKKIITFRFGFVHSDRIGHFAANTELYLCYEINKKKKVKTIDFFYFPTKPCNSYLGLLISRKLNFYPKFLIRPFCLIVRKFYFLRDHVAGKPPMRDHDIYNYYEKYRNQIKLNKYEIKKGNSILNKINPQKKPIILLIIRDSKYLKDVTNTNSFSYHNHRDDNIARYDTLVKHIIKKGFFVIRMGKVAKKRLKINDENFLDYPFSKYRNDFMDIFLGYKCELCISNVTGYDAVPTIFRKPMLFYGSIPVGYMLTSSKKFINTFYDHYSLKLKRRLTMEEIFMNKLDNKFKLNDFKKKKIILKKMSSTLMIKIFDETINYLNNNYRLKKSVKNLQLDFKKKYLDNLKKYSKNDSLNYHRKINSYFPKSWLIENNYLLR